MNQPLIAFTPQRFRTLEVPLWFHKVQPAKRATRHQPLKFMTFGNIVLNLAPRLIPAGQVHAKCFAGNPPFGCKGFNAAREQQRRNDDERWLLQHSHGGGCWLSLCRVLSSEIPYPFWQLHKMYTHSFDRWRTHRAPTVHQLLVAVIMKIYPHN